MTTAQLDLGGGIVRRRITVSGIRAEFDAAGGVIPIGTVLTADEMGKFRLANLRSMISHKQIEIWPMAANGGAAQMNGQRHIVAREDGKFDVVQGIVVNEKPVSRKIADKLVAQGKN